MDIQLNKNKRFHIVKRHMESSPKKTRRRKKAAGLKEEYGSCRLQAGMRQNASRFLLPRISRSSRDGAGTEKAQAGDAFGIERRVSRSV